MKNFSQIDFLDCFRLTASLHTRQHLLKEQRCLLRAGADYWDPQTCDEKWQALRNVVSRIERHQLAQNFVIEWGDVLLLSVPPHSGSEWLSYPDPIYQFLHLPIITNPSVRVHSGLECLHVPFWVLTWVNSAPLGCVANPGDEIAVHLVVEFRSKPQ